MSFRYRIESTIISSDHYLFEESDAEAGWGDLKFLISDDPNSNRHVVRFFIEADNYQAAWQDFYKKVYSFVEAAAFQTTSYLAFHDWNYIITNLDQNVALISMYERASGTSLSLYSQEDYDDVQSLIAQSDADSRLKNFLHCYRMAILVDAPETRDAYEKYLILACESLAGEIPNRRGNGFTYDKERLVSIIGDDLFEYFYVAQHPVLGKTRRNAHMHVGQAPDQKNTETVKLVTKLRQFVSKEYGMKATTILDEKLSPTRGYYRDDGGNLLITSEQGLDINLSDYDDLESFIKSKSDDVDFFAGGAYSEAFKIF
jgi:hypothetical protein